MREGELTPVHGTVLDGQRRISVVLVEEGRGPR
jgi:hypothetical protein